MRKLTTYFLKGLALLVPMMVTIYVVYIVFAKIDKLFKFPIPGVGFVITIIAITAIGFIGSNLLPKKLAKIPDIILSRLPFLKMIYSSVKDITGAFVGDHKKGFKPVAVTLSPGSGIQVVGFATRDNLDEFGLLDSVAVYLPQSYNFAGNLIIVPKEQVRPLSADSADIMKFIVFGGIAQTSHDNVRIKSQ